MSKVGASITTSLDGYMTTHMQYRVVR